jgi:hypothetical protein
MRFCAHVEDHSQWDCIRAFNQSEYIRRRTAMHLRARILAQPGVSERGFEENSAPDARP